MTSVLSHLFAEPFALPFMRRALAEALLLGVLGGVVGVFVSLRRLAFLADALTHTVFPGVVLGYLVASVDGVVWGALLFAVLSAVLLSVLAATDRVSQDSALAILLTGLFAVGVLIVSRRHSFAADLTVFLFGRILTVDTTEIVVTAVIAVLVGGTLAVLGKELLLRAFDPAGAAALGYRVALLDLALNLVVALVVVAAVRAVGTVLVIALLVVPAATARLLSQRLAVLFTLAALLGAAGGWLGLTASYLASVDHGVRLASGATVVLAMVALYLLALVVRSVPAAAGWSRRRLVRRGAA
jgi:manganese/iron transport system permease protein